MEKTDIETRITEQMARCSGAMERFVINAGDNTCCHTIEITSVVRVMRASAKLAIALVRLKQAARGRGVLPPRGSNGTPP